VRLTKRRLVLGGIATFVILWLLGVGLLLAAGASSG
jgi:hypothetical protein